MHSVLITHHGGMPTLYVGAELSVVNGNATIELTFMHRESPTFKFNMSLVLFYTSVS